MNLPMSSYAAVERIADLNAQLAAERARADRMAAILRKLGASATPLNVLAEHDADRARRRPA